LIIYKKIPEVIENIKLVYLCTIWNDVRTYLTLTISPQEKTALLLAISYFKNKKEDLK